jgi:hypothetical protein
MIITNANRRAEAFRTGDSIFFANFGAFFLMYIPMDNGTAITAIKDLKISPTGGLIDSISFPKYANEKLIINGIVKMVTKLLIAVKEIESGKSPFAKRAIILELVPPGHATSIIIPIAIKGSGLKTRQSPNPTKGNNTIWLKRPMNTGFGFSATRLKSCKDNPSPIPAIIIMIEMAKNKVDA